MPAAPLYAAGYITGIATFYWIARRRGLATFGIFCIAIFGLIGGLLGATLGQYLTTGQAGKSVLGAIVGGWLAVWFSKKVLGIRRPTGDLFAVAVSAGESIGRWGCLVGGCCYGKPTTVAWGIMQHDAHRHPTQIYLSLTNLLILLVLLGLEYRKPPENLLFAVQGVLYCAARFIIEFFRETLGVHAGLTSAQWVCLIGLACFAAKWFAVCHHERSVTYEALPEL